MLEGVHRVKVIDIVKAKSVDTLRSTITSNVHETGILNPTLIVRGFGYAVKGLSVGDCVDINPEPGCLVRRAVADIDDDYESIHDHYYTRNPNMAKAVNLDKLSKVILPNDKPKQDADNPDAIVELKFAYVIEARLITGIYYNKKTVDIAIQAFDLEDRKPKIVPEIEIADINVSNQDSVRLEGSDHDIDKVKLIDGGLTPTPDYIKGVNASDK